MNGRTIAIGDIHGHAVALNALLDWITPAEDDTLITLGDVVDRGPDTFGAIETLLKLRSSCNLIWLLGNHEEMMLTYLSTGDMADFRFWVEYGGGATIDSYGGSKRQFDVPDEHRDFLEESAAYFENADVMFSHANYIPELSLAETNAEYLRWRHLERRLLKPHQSGKSVVVGHTAQATGEVFDLGFLTCIDTACCHGGYLTAMDVGRRYIWQVDPEGRRRTVEPYSLDEMLQEYEDVD